MSKLNKVIAVLLAFTAIGLVLLMAVGDNYYWENFLYLCGMLASIFIAGDLLER